MKLGLVVEADGCMTCGWRKDTRREQREGGKRRHVVELGWLRGFVSTYSCGCLVDGITGVLTPH